MAVRKKLHAIMISFPFQGHITPFINLALKLASNGCIVTFVHTDAIHHMLSKAHHQEEPAFFSGARESGLDICYKTIYDGFPQDFDRILNFNEYWEAILRDFPSRVREFVGHIIQSDDESNLVPLLVTDTFYSWPAIVAKEYKILNVSFWTEPALVFAIDYHLDLLREKGHFPSKGDNQGDDLIDFIQGVPPIKSKDLMSYLQETDITTITHQIVIKAFQQAKFADFILINSVNELERETISSLNQKQPTYAIGPINFTIDFTKTIVPKSLWSEKDCTQWLSPKSPGSVLYISFGSLAEHNKQLAEEMAYGLLLSEVEFIWVMKEDNDVLPDGFKNEMGNKGLIVSWCNQNAVISNPAVGGFVTHCGWNSILESIWCGVPMICFPLFADQPSNRKLVVDDWKIGINLCDGVSVSKEEVAEKVKQLMIGERSKELRREMEKVRTIVHKALGQNGSTNRNFDQFLKDLRSKVDANS